MPTRLVQSESHASGTAAFQVNGPGAAQMVQADEVEIAIVQPGPTERYLDPRNPDDPWTTSVYRFRPLAPRREGAALWLEIDYGVTYHLRANQPYKLRLRLRSAGGGGGDAEEVFTVPAALRRPAAKPTGWTPPPDPRGPLTAPLTAAEPVRPPPVPPPLPLPTEPLPQVQAEAAAEVWPPPAPMASEPLFADPPSPRVDPTPKLKPLTKLKRKVWLLPLLLLLAVGGAAAAYFVLAGGGTDSGALASMDACRREVATAPEPAAAREKAAALGQRGKLLDCQFLLYKYAGEKGDTESARTLGTWYDPDTWSKDKSPLPAPNPGEAARWHKQAAEAGDAESQFRYAMLLKLGRTDAADGPEQAQVWLRKSADQGNALAKEELAR